MFNKNLYLKQFSLLLVILVFYVSCSDIQKKIIDYKILTPKSDWMYYSDSKITFSTNLNSEKIMWYSDKDGYLGNGNSFVIKLTPGFHKIKAIFQDSEKSVEIYVGNRQFSYGDTVRYLVNSLQQSLSIPEGTYNPAVIALDGSLNQASINTNTDGFKLKKDIHIDMELTKKKVIWHDARAAFTRGYSLNDEKKFYVINTKQQTLEPHEITAKVIRTSESYNVWYPVNPEIYSDIIMDDDSLDLCLKEIESRIIPRLKKLWGKIPDIDNDGKFSFLFTPTINEEETAIGFFNPEDFYKRDDASPYSNEMDILYIAVPESKKFSYSVECISATIAHELTHAINYNTKTYSRFLKDASNPPVEETFLDEAQSHLSESLCGYGISGGNISILHHYLNNLEMYSVCKNDYMGNDDTNGRRAAATMFLSWLFWKKGGISWNPENPVEIINKGGIDFIQNLVSSNGTGWENIGDVFGIKTDLLYVQMVEELNAVRASVLPIILDPYSGEPVQLYPDYQVYHLNGTDKSWELTIPEKKTGSLVHLIPYSFVIYEQCKNEFSLNSSSFKGQILGLLYNASQM